MSKQSLDPLGLGYALAILSALCMLLLGIAGNLGVYEGAVEMMQEWHLFFDLSVGGIIAGIVEAAVFSFIGGFLFGWIYNRVSK